MMELNPSTFHYKPKVTREERDRRDAELRDLIEQIHLEFPKAGYRTLREYLWRSFAKSVNEKKIRRIQKKFSLFAEIKRAFIHTTDSNHPYPVYENLTRNFCPIVPDCVWVADITYIRIATGFLYLAVVMDRCSRRIIGWALGRQRNVVLTLRALNHAVASRCPKPGLIFHTDRGIEYYANAFRERLAQLQVIQSMNRPGKVTDKAFMESFFHSMKADVIHGNTFSEDNQLLSVLRSYIPFYNHSRMHSSLNYVSPARYEIQFT